MVESTTQALHPDVKWGNMKSSLWITIEVPDVVNKKLDVTDTSLTFSGKNSTTGQVYEVKMCFFKEVDSSNMKEHHSQRHIQLEIPKKTRELWPRALKESHKPVWLKADFQHFQDDDEDSDRAIDGMPDMGMGDFAPDFSSFMNKMKLGGDNGLDGMDGLDADADEEDSDDEELPDLEKHEKA